MVSSPDFCHKAFKLFDVKFLLCFGNIFFVMEAFVQKGVRSEELIWLPSQKPVSADPPPSLSLTARLCSSGSLCEAGDAGSVTAD